MERNEQKLLFKIYSKITLEEFDEESSDESDLAEIINLINNCLFECMPNYVAKIILKM